MPSQPVDLDLLSPRPASPSRSAGFGGCACGRPSDATAIRLRTASTEALLRRFTSETTHPAYAAMLEVGRAQRSIFLARWLRDRDLQRETESGHAILHESVKRLFTGPMLQCPARPASMGLVTLS